MFFVVLFFPLLFIQLDYSIELFIIFIFWKNSFLAELIQSYVIIFNPAVITKNFWFQQPKFFKSIFNYLTYFNYSWQPLFKKGSYYNYFRNNREFWLNSKFKK